MGVLLCDSLTEAQAALLRAALARGGRGDKLASLLIGRVEKQRKKLGAAGGSTFHTQRGQYSVHVSAGRHGTNGRADSSRLAAACASRRVQTR